MELGGLRSPDLSMEPGLAMEPDLSMEPNLSMEPGLPPWNAQETAWQEQIGEGIEERGNVGKWRESRRN